MDALLDLVKALADESRLKIVGLLACRPHSVEELAEVLELRSPTVSHHLKKLSRVGLVASRAEGHHHVYALQLKTLNALRKEHLREDALQAFAQADARTYEDKVLASFLDREGRLVRLPMKRKKFDVILRHALERFEAEGEWSEREVDERLSSLTDDVASLRRGFIDHGYMTRHPSGAWYRRVAEAGRS
ncbi:MAG: metalloregulator ArsR/SmtB family transcription factor [Myxococcota bacterium]